jgi:hypothetical protein
VPNEVATAAASATSARQTLFTPFSLLVVADREFVLRGANQPLTIELAFSALRAVEDEFAFCVEVGSPAFFVIW